MDMPLFCMAPKHGEPRERYFLEEYPKYRQPQFHLSHCHRPAGFSDNQTTGPNDQNDSDKKQVPVVLDHMIDSR